VADLIEFLRARLAEDEAAALAADVKQGDPRWKYNPVMAAPGCYTVRSADSNRPVARVEDVGDDINPEDPESGPRSILDGESVATHIARWDPARVLAEVSSKRAILDLHKPCHVEGDPWSCTDGHYGSEGLGLDGAQPARCGVCWGDEWDMGGGPQLMASPCPTLLAVAQPYADHPDFDPAWRVDGAS
jgi:hypothetical protein